MSKHKEHVPSGSGIPIEIIPAEPMPVRSERTLPRLLWVAYAVFLIIGIGLLLSKRARTESAAFDAISGCEASVLAENDGLSDLYGVVQFRSNGGEVASYLGYCENDPELALSVFRKALQDGNKSAKLAALSSTFYLARKLEKSDIDNVAALLKPGNDNADLRKAAQRALSDLIVIKNAADPSKYRTVPDSLPPPTTGYHSIQTQEQTWLKEPVLGVRWSNPDVALDWWKRLGSAGTLERGPSDSSPRLVISDKK